MFNHVLQEVKVIDFNNIEAESFKDLDVGYCCLGTTKKQAGSAVSNTIKTLFHLSSSYFILMMF